MCGIFSVINLSSDHKSIDLDFAIYCSDLLQHRGPDSSDYCFSDNGSFFSHKRLSIIDNSNKSNQPFISRDSKSILCFNGEIYNYRELSYKYFGKEFKGDTETLSELFNLLDPIEIISELEGMYALIIYYPVSNTFYILRDFFGIKPLYYQFIKETLVISSEPYPISVWSKQAIDPQSVNEIKVFRRPTPGYSFYKNVNELLPGHYLSDKLNSNSKRLSCSDFKANSKDFNHEFLYSLLSHKIKLNTVSDVPVTGFQSGGIDSTIVNSIAKPSKLYSVGFIHDNEFTSAKRISDMCNIPLETYQLDKDLFINYARQYLAIKREPITVPNEILIFYLCKNLPLDRKFFLTGEGADEIFFGYDRIFRWAYKYNKITSYSVFLDSFLNLYSYSDQNVNDGLVRMKNYIYKFVSNYEYAINFLEDFFLTFHLPGLLMRVDRASMAAGKEARVPFCTKSIADYLYRRPYHVRLSINNSKLPLRRFLNKSNLSFVSKYPKIGFRANLPNMNNLDMYKYISKLSSEYLHSITL